MRPESLLLFPVGFYFVLSYLSTIIISLSRDGVNRLFYPILSFFYFSKKVFALLISFLTVLSVSPASLAISLIAFPLR